jgi:hypothetical protein
MKFNTYKRIVHVKRMTLIGQINLEKLNFKLPDFLQNKQPKIEGFLNLSTFIAFFFLIVVILSQKNVRFEIIDP